MRLAIDATPLIGARTGVGVAAAGIIDALSAIAAVEVHPYALTWRGRGELGRDSLVAPLPRLPMAARPLRELWKRADWPPIEWWTGPVDVVHGTNYVVPPTRAAAAVATVYDLTFMHFPEMCTADTLAYPGLIRRALSRGAWVHTSSHAIAGEIEEAFPGARGRVVVVPLGLDPIERPAGPSPHPFPYILALGTIEPRKDLVTLVAAFDAVAESDADVRLVVAGPDGWGTDAFAEAVASAKHRDRILREGFVSGPRRAGLLAHAAVFAYPSVYEGFGLPPLEAMSLGVPVVASTAGSLPEVLGDAADLVEPGQADALAAALTRALTDEDHRETRVARGLDRAAQYTWPACATGLLSLYETATRDR